MTAGALRTASPHSSCYAEVWSLQKPRWPLCQGQRESAEQCSRWPQTGISLRWQIQRVLRLTKVPRRLFKSEEGGNLGPSILTDQFRIQQGPEIPLWHHTNSEGPTWQDVSGGCYPVCVCVSRAVSVCPLLASCSHWFLTLSPKVLKSPPKRVLWCV